MVHKQVRRGESIANGVEARGLAEADADAQVAHAQSGKVGANVKGDIDDLLAEVDSVLETNAEEFVRNYVQKGGQ